LIYVFFIHNQSVFASSQSLAIIFSAQQAVSPGWEKIA
jgi:hypothetical protein